MFSFDDMSESCELKKRNSQLLRSLGNSPQRPPHHHTTWIRRQGTPNLQYTQPAVKVSVSLLNLQSYLLELTNIPVNLVESLLNVTPPPHFPPLRRPLNPPSRRNRSSQQAEMMTIAIPYTGQYPTTISRSWNFWLHARTLILISRSVGYDLRIAMQVLKEGLGWVGLDTIDDGMQH